MESIHLNHHINFDTELHRMTAQSQGDLHMNGTVGAASSIKPRNRRAGVSLATSVKLDFLKLKLDSACCPPVPARQQLAVVNYHPFSPLHTPKEDPFHALPNRKPCCPDP